MHSLTIGIVAHVDAGKTSLTERLLFNAGVIKTLGSVDRGTTQTDNLTLERQRGITIKSAVVSFDVGNLKINLVDTPGHPDFIAEVERSLAILDAVILVISAVEGIQPQTKVLMRTLKKLELPTLIFVNKVDRAGARSAELVEDIKAKLFPDVLAMNEVINLGTKDAYITPFPGYRNKLSDQELTEQISAMQFCPVFFGSALTGVGVSELTQALATYFATDHDHSPNGKPQSPLSAFVFKLERSRRDEKIAYIRVYAGTLHSRMPIEIHRPGNNSEVVSFASRITTMQLFKAGATVEVQTAHAGDIVKVWGLHDVQIGDYIGQLPAKHTVHFAPPSLEAVIKPQYPDDRSKLHTALQRMSEQDPLIRVWQNEQGVLSLRLYGEVQREVIQATLRDDHGLVVTFEPTQTIYIEKVCSTGESYAEKFAPDSMFIATLGFKIVPGQLNSDVIFKPDAGVGRIPVSYMKIVEEMVRQTLKQGIYGWEVTDCVVEITKAGYESAMSTGTDFRRLTPLLIAEALQKAGTDVHEPMNRFELEIPEPLLAQMLQSLAASEARVDMTAVNQGICHIEGVLPVRRTTEFEKNIPDLTQSEGVFISEPSGYQKAYGPTPIRPRTDNNPFNKEEYLRRVLRRG